MSPSPGARPPAGTPSPTAPALPRAPDQDALRGTPPGAHALFGAVAPRAPRNLPGLMAVRAERKLPRLVAVRAQRKLSGVVAVRARREFSGVVAP